MILASQKYGNAEVMTKIGGMTLSMSPPRLHPISPIIVPSTKARIVVTPTSTRVHGSAWRTSFITGSGKNVSEIPKSPAERVAEIGEVRGEEALVRLDSERDLDRVQSAAD